MSTKRLDTTLLDSKQFTKYAKHADDKNAKELIQKPKEELERIIVDCELYEQKIKAETKANKNYQKALDDKATFTKAERDTLTPVKAKKALATLALQSLKDNP